MDPAGGLPAAIGLPPPCRGARSGGRRRVADDAATCPGRRRAARWREQCTWPRSPRSVPAAIAAATASSAHGSSRPVAASRTKEEHDRFSLPSPPTTGRRCSTVPDAARATGGSRPGTRWSSWTTAPPTTPRLLERLAASFPVPLRMVREPDPGKSHALAAALPHCAADVFAFTDDDVLVADDWMSGRATRWAPAARISREAACCPSSSAGALMARARRRRLRRLASPLALLDYGTS